MAGNVFEWTTESYYTNVCVHRGGNYNSSNDSASSRYENTPSYQSSYNGSRSTLYITL